MLIDNTDVVFVNKERILFISILNVAIVKFSFSVMHIECLNSHIVLQLFSVQVCN